MAEAFTVMQETERPPSGRSIQAWSTEPPEQQGAGNPATQELQPAYRPSSTGSKSLSNAGSIENMDANKKGCCESFTSKFSVPVTYRFQ